MTLLAGTKFNTPDRATCPRDARGCASDVVIRRWFELAGILAKSVVPEVPSRPASDGEAGATSTDAAAADDGRVRRIWPATSPPQLQPSCLVC
jgi:hypothetical protein